MGNLQQTINFAKTFVEYVPITAGLGQEPAVSVASMIRFSLLNPPFTWFFNRGESTFPTIVGTQDYNLQLSDLAFVEAVSLTDDQGNIYQIKDVYNNSALAISGFQQRPNSMSVEKSFISNGLLNFTFRFLGVPDQVYTVTVTYQKIAPSFGPFFITSAAAHNGNNTSYAGSFEAISFPVGATAIITGFTNAANNGSFLVVSCNATTLVLANSAGVAETITAYACNFSWDPIPSQYADVYNNLFLAEILAVGDDNRSQIYRQRGVAALLSKASGLTEMQKNAFAQQWLQRDMERQSKTGMVQLGHVGRGT